MPEAALIILKDWWGFAAFLIGGIVAYSAGRERQRYKVDQIWREVEKLGRRIGALERQGNSEAVHRAEIATSQAHILASLDEIKQALRGKADK